MKQVKRISCKWLAVLLLAAMFGGIIGESGMGIVSFAKNAKNEYDFTGIYITRSSVALKIEGSTELSVRKIGVSKAASIQWISGDESVATVENGVVKAVGIGQTVIRAVYEDYMSECIVKVTESDPVHENYQHTMELLQDFYDLRFGMFLHFNSSTYEFATIGGDWAGESYQSTFVPSRTWDPSDLDCHQWAQAAKSAGMTFAVLTTKHHDGFDLWDSAYTDYDVGSAKNKTDVVKEFTDACRDEGILPGLYFSMLDVKHKITSSDCKDSDIEFIKAQITELLTNYGEIPFIIFDAWNAYWGGPNYDLLPYDEIVNLVHTLQPNCLVINISCEANNVHSEVAMFESAAGQEVPDWYNNVNISCNTPSNHWFWCDSYTTDTFKTVDWILNQNINPYIESNTVFILNVSPNQKGVLINKYLELLEAVGKGYSKPADSVSLPEDWAADYDFTQNLLFRKSVSQSSVSGNSSPERAVDGFTDPETDHETSIQTNNGTDPWWSGDIGYSASLGKLKIYAGSGIGAVKRATVFVSDQPFAKMNYSSLSSDQNVKAFSISSAASKDDYFEIDLGGIQGRYVCIMLKGSGALALTEVVLNPAGISDSRIIGLRSGWSNLTAASGTAFADLGLPKEANFITADGSLISAKLNWDETGYSTDFDAGKYTLTCRPEGSEKIFTCTLTVTDSSRFRTVMPASVKASSNWTTSPGWAYVGNVISDEGMVIDPSNLLYSTHDNAYNATSMWHSADGVTSAELIFTFEAPTVISQLLIWNHNQQNLVNRGAKNIELYGTLSDAPADSDWTKIGEYTLHKATDSPYQTATDLLYIGEQEVRQIKMVLKDNYGSTTQVGLSQVFFLQSDSGKGRLVNAVSSFELLSAFDYPEQDYDAAQAIYQACVEALEDGETDQTAAALCDQMDEALSRLESVRSEKKIDGLSSLTAEVNVGASSLPETVEIILDGEKRSVKVIWQPLAEGAFSTPTSMTVQGRIEGTPCPVLVSVAVRGQSNDALKSLIETYDKLDLSGYTDESAAAFKTALIEAKEVLNNSSADQNAIDQAKYALKHAKYALINLEYQSISATFPDNQNSGGEQAGSHASENSANITSKGFHMPVVGWIGCGVLGAAIIGAAAYLLIRKKKK